MQQGRQRKTSGYCLGDLANTLNDDLLLSSAFPGFFLKRQDFFNQGIPDTCDHFFHHAN